jgi:hypothetical protein
MAGDRKRKNVTIKHRTSIIKTALLPPTGVTEHKVIVASLFLGYFMTI